MARNEPACVLGTEAPLDRRLEQVPGLRQDRKQKPHEAGRRREADTTRIGNRDRCGNPPGKTPDRPRPGLVRAHPWPEQRTADSPAAEEGENVSCPNSCEQEQ